MVTLAHKKESANLRDDNEDSPRVVGPAVPLMFSTTTPLSVVPSTASVVTGHVINFTVNVKGMGSIACSSY
jgi:hypothetical protein